MRAVRIHEHGGVEQLRLEEIPLPEPGPGQVQVRVAACGLNHLDLLIREGKLPVPVEMPRTLGAEVAGEVSGVGPGVNGIAPGTRVAVATRLACGRCEYCVRGEDNICLKSAAIGMEADGGYAEYMVAPAVNMVPLPDGVEYRQAAAAILSYLTAWHMLRTRARLQAGEDLLVIAGGSGIGSAAIQIGRLLGARVIASGGSEDKLDHARELGAFAAVNHHDEDWDRQVRALTGKRGVDVVFEHVGAATWEKSVNALGRNGRLVTCGAHTGAEVTLIIWKLFTKQLTLIGSYLGTRAELHEVLRLIGQGHLTPVIHRVYPLEKARAAQEELEASRHFGKILLEP